MKILHIGDIHLGSTLDNQRRNEEFRKIFRFLTKKVKTEGIEAALFAGDVFDNGSPSNESQNLYYDFLLDLQEAGCRQIIAIAGNHDNANFLEAPQGLLRRMNIHVIGKVDQDHPEDEVIALGAADNPAAYVCAVPYLRERDVRGMIPEGESSAGKAEALNKGIIEHYKTVFELADTLRAGRDIPIIAMGHFYALGSSFAAAASGSGEEQPETVGTLDAVDLKYFPQGFAYGALGHIHKPQIVPGFEKWRYAGSLLKMQLRKNMYAPQVILLDSTDTSHPRGVEIPDECFHKMQVIEGDMAELRRKLTELMNSGSQVWVKPIYTGEEVLPNWQIDLRLEFRDSCVQLIHPEVKRKTEKETDSDPEFSETTLAQLTPEMVFLEALKANQVSDEQQKYLLELYRSAEKQVCDPAEMQEKPEPASPGKTMKFKRLWIKNINSLYGENQIDFENPAFNSGIFLISGDTGAGKSSILDAICLALYGCTPRAAKTPNKNQDCIMSEGTREMIAELTFMLGDDEYRARFSHERTRANSQTPFRDAKHQLYCNSKEIAMTKSALGKYIPELIGLDMAQFTKCVLLAQGSFDAFLKAGTAERSGILTNITGTEVYGRIGRQINLRTGETEKQYDAAKTLLDNTPLLPEEAAAELGKQLEQDQNLQKENENQIRKFESQRQLFADIKTGKIKEQEAAERLKSLQQQNTAAEPDRQRLSDAKRAQACNEQYLVCRQWRKAVDDAKKQLASLEQQEKILLKSAEESAAALQAGDAERQKKNAEQSEKQTLFKEIREMDTRLAEKEKIRANAEKELSAAKNRQKKLQSDFRRKADEWKALQERSKQAADYLKAHEKDAALENQKPAWELRRQQLVKEENANSAERQKISALRQGLNQLKTGLAPLSAAEKRAEQAVAKHQQELKTAEEKIRELLAGETRESLKEAWLAAVRLQGFHQRAASYEEDRKNLKPGDRCPLCGATIDEHFISVDKNRLSIYEQDAKRLEKIRDEVEVCDELLRTGAKKGAELTAKQLECRHARENLEQNIARQEQELEQRTHELEEAAKTNAATAAALAEEFRNTLQCGWDDHSALPPELDLRITRYREAAEAAALQEQGRIQFENEQKIFESQSRDCEQTLQQLTANFDAVRTDCGNLRKERQDKFAGDVNEAEKQLRQQVEAAQKKYEAAAEKAARTKADADNNSKNRTECSRKLQDEFIPALAKSEKDFLEQLGRKGFADEKSFTEKLLAAETMDSLEKSLEDLNTKLTEAKTALDERRKSLAEKQAALPPDVTEEAISEELAVLTAKKNELQLRIQETMVKLKTDEDNKKSAADLRKQTDELQIQYNRWKYLDDHFGNSDGAKFSRIAQGYTFRSLVALANKNRLTALQKHFKLKCDRHDPLELNVIDHYRGDVERTSRNLSGGESFEVSLALALGLAEMSSVSQKASLGNVLLDEGFGTLDDKALDSALDLLMQLRGSSRKLVGIISHVEKLKDKIETQIHVANSAGVGILSGAGVSTGSKAKGE